MKPARSIPLLVSVSLVLFLLGGGLAVKVGAEENSFHQVVLFSEEQREGRGNHGYTLWSILSLAAWLEMAEIGPDRIASSGDAG